MREWQDISTAPKDGTAILVFQATDGDHKDRMAIAWCWDHGGFWRCSDYPGLQPTHWMPPPPRPAGLPLG